MTDITKNIEEVNLNQISTESNDFSSSIQYEDLTSQEIYDDLHTHYSTHKNMLMDYEYISIFWEAICGNKHLFKDKVSTANRFRLIKLFDNSYSRLF